MGETQRIEITVNGFVETCTIYKYTVQAWVYANSIVCGRDGQLNTYRTRYRLMVNNSFISAAFVVARSLIRSLRGSVDAGAGGKTIDGGADGACVCNR